MRDLTIRGRCFLAAGAAAIICGIEIGERDFVRIGLLAMVVPLLAWLLLRRTERKVWVRRNVSALQVEAGDIAYVEVEIGNAGRRTGTLLLEEELSPALGAPPRFVVPPLAAGANTLCEYQIHTESRGRYPVGPMHVRVSDPLGMVDFDQVIASTATILVTPRTEALPQIPLTGRWAGAGDNRTRDLLGGGSPDVTIREYRLGDDLRRIHWPTSARAGELMVRREEQQWQSRCTLLIDNRRIAHRGSGQKSSMERAVSVAASIMRTLVAQDFEVRLVSATGQSTSHGWHQATRGVNLTEQLERLALMTMTSQEKLSTRWIEDNDQGGMLLAVVGHLDDADQDLLTGMAAAGDSAYAVVLDVATWSESPGPTSVPGDGLAAQRRLEGHHPPARRLAPQRLVGAGAMTVTVTQTQPPEVRSERFDRWRPGAPLLAMVTGWVAAFAWSGLVVLPLGYLVPTLMLGTVMVVAGSILRMFRLPVAVIALAEAVIGLLELNLAYASHESFLGVVPTVGSLRELFYVIGNGAETLNTYASPVTVNPTHTHAFLVTCGLGLLLSIDIIAFGLRRPPLVALPLLVAVSVPVSILNEGLAVPVFVAVALLFMRLLASEHIDRLWAWGGNRQTAPKPKLETLWQVALIGVVVALLVAPLVPVTDLLHRNSNALGDGTSAGGQLHLTTVNPFIRMRRDLIAQTHTPLLYADTEARDTGYIRTTVLDQFREDEWRPSQRNLPSQNKADGAMPGAPGLAQRVTGTTDNWKLRLAPTFQTDWLPLPYPTQTVKVAGPWRYDSDTLDVAYVGDSPPPPELSYQATSFTPDVTARLLQFAPRRRPGSGSR